MVYGSGNEHEPIHLKEISSNAPSRGGSHFLFFSDMVHVYLVIEAFLQLSSPFLSFWGPMRIQTLMTLLLLTTSTATALPIDNSWIQDHFDVGISMLMGGSLASQIPAAWKRFDTFVRANHDLVTYGLSQHQRDVISCAQRAIDNEDVSFWIGSYSIAKGRGTRWWHHARQFLAGRSAKERGEVAWKNCEDNPQWDPAVEMCVQRAVENESVSVISFIYWGFQNILW